MVSNFLKYSDNGTIEGFQSEMIHVFNKNEQALEGTPFYDLVRDRDNIIVMGDSLGDAGMASGVPQTNAVLKIGYVYDQNEASSIPAYKETFDIVLNDDQTMEVVHAILKRVLLGN